MSTKNILIVEDDLQMMDLLNIHLRDQQFHITKAYKGDIGLNLALQQSYDLIILDVMLPEVNGLDICRELRTNHVFTPIIFLTARGEEIDKVLGLECGADDYITKPFGIRELVARVRACLRRREMLETSGARAKKLLAYGELEIDEEKRLVKLKGQRIDLTPKEFDLLLTLANNPGKSYSREKLLELVWGTKYKGYGHNVNSHINRLRSKIEGNLSEPRYILTTWGIGYRFADV